MKKQRAESGCVGLLPLLTTAERRGEPLPVRARYRPNEWAHYGVQFGWNRGAMNSMLHPVIILRDGAFFIAKWQNKREVYTYD